MINLNTTILQLTDADEDDYQATLNWIEAAREARRNPPPFRTKEESVIFRKAWDARVQSGKDKEQTP